MSLRAPFPWFGGKSRVAHLVWERFGDVPNYVEPFAGSLAVLLNRPHEPRVETVNDLDCYLANFWRAVSAAPAEVAAAADWPINEADLHSRHRWLVNRARFRERMKTEPNYFNAKIAGWWVWGISQWIGSGWCSQPEWTGRAGCYNSARGIHTTDWNGRPSLRGMGVHRKGPNLGGRNNKGVHRMALSQQMPCLHGDSGATGRGIHASGLHRKLLKMDRGTQSRLMMRREALCSWFEALQSRLRNVRVCCGDWRRILGPSPTIHIGVTGVFLDPPYEPSEIARGAGQDGFSRSDKLYAGHDAGLSAQVREWALEHAEDPRLRIALCGYEGEHKMPASWQVLPWKAAGGYSNRGANPRRNAERERIWFSPSCLRPIVAGPLFAETTTA
jgi:DNA adenine methylase